MHIRQRRGRLVRFKTGQKSLEKGSPGVDILQTGVFSDEHPGIESWFYL